MDTLAKETTGNRIVEINDLHMYFPVTKGLLRKKIADVKAVDGVSFHINKGEVLGLVGESGSGKTTTGRCLLRLYKPTSGEILFNGEDISTYPENKIRPLRQKMSLVFQDPYSSLNPRHTAADIVGEPLIVHNLVQSKAEYKDRVDELFKMVGLDPSMSDRVPHEFSGGQRQRIGMARALAVEPSLIVCDEPVSALDVSIQAQIINLLMDLQEKIDGLTYLFIAHDLAVVRHISQRIAVMYLGRVVEITDRIALYENPLHPYTQALLSAIPMPDPKLERQRQRIVLRGEVPSPMSPPPGCSFHPRCAKATEECRKSVPFLQDAGDNHQVACWNAD